MTMPDMQMSLLLKFKHWREIGDKTPITIEHVGDITVNYRYDNRLSKVYSSIHSNFLNSFEPYDKEDKLIPIIKGSIDMSSKDDSNKPKAVELLDTSAATLIRCGKKYDSTGNNSERVMDRIVDMFNAATGHELTEAQGNIFMVCLKVVRSETSTYHDDDHYIDGINYFAMAGESASESANKGDE